MASDRRVLADPYEQILELGELLPAGTLDELELELTQLEDPLVGIAQEPAI